MNRSRGLKFFLGVIGIGILASCPASASKLPSCKETWKNLSYKYNFKEKYADFYRRLKRDECEKDWTVLVYMAADNNLFPYALWDLFEMEARFESDKNPAASTLKTDLVVQVDGPASDDARRLHMISGVTKFKRAAKADFTSADLSMIQSPKVESLPENLSESEESRLTKFLLWGAEKYPSQHLMVVVWSHGQGWKAYPFVRVENGGLLNAADLAMPGYPTAKPDKSFGGIAFKASSGTWLDIPALQRSLARLAQARGKATDVYASDACLMQMIEVAYEVSDQADYLSGTTQVQNFLGLPYRRMLYELNTGHFLNGNDQNDDEPYLLAKMIPSLVQKSLDPTSGLQREAGIDAQKRITASSLTSAELKRFLIPRMAQLSHALKEFLSKDSMRALDLALILQNVPNIEGSAQDLSIFLGFIELLLKAEVQNQGSLDGTGDSLKDAMIETKNALERTTLSFAYGPAYGVDEATQRIGFIPRATSIWLPVNPEEYKKRRPEFLRSRFYQDTQWNQWLDLLFP